MTIALTWLGPLRPGNLPTASQEILQLDLAAVYLRVKVYEGERLVAYVGQTTHLIRRIDQHLSRLVSLANPLRNRVGEPIYNAAFDSRLAAFNDLERVSTAVVAEVNRIQFFYALCDDVFHDAYLDIIERLLKARIEDRAVRVDFACENQNAVALRQIPDDVDRLQAVNDFSGLKSATRERLQTLLGEEPIEIALAELEAGFA
ncbi:MAG: hypothetical protein O3A21_04330 [Proteobacteria bacterium]|nr:hypothetical protein [Pseudomonadota bacterium]